MLEVSDVLFSTGGGGGGIANLIKTLDKYSYSRTSLLSVHVSHCTGLAGLQMWLKFFVCNTRHFVKQFAANIWLFKQPSHDISTPHSLR